MKEKYFDFRNNLSTSDISENIIDKLCEFHKYFRDLSNGKANRICIFCAGLYGIRLYEELSSRFIQIDCFCDNNPQKWGYLFENIYCIEPKILESQKDRTQIIVSTKEPIEIVNQLKELGFPYIITKQEIDTMLFEIPTVKNNIELKTIQNIDFSSQSAMLLVDKFNETVFETCKFYENKLANKEK